jgi:hypothetical protein
MGRIVRVCRGALVCVVLYVCIQSLVGACMVRVMVCIFLVHVRVRVQVQVHVKGLGFVCC